VEKPPVAWHEVAPVELQVKVVGLPSSTSGGIMMTIVGGHCCVLQDCVLLVGVPEQLEPLQERELVCVPPPHVVEQLLHPPQSEHEQPPPQSTLELH
jgi:hypothetical protein